MYNFVELFSESIPKPFNEVKSTIVNILNQTGCTYSTTIEDIKEFTALFVVNQFQLLSGYQFRIVYIYLVSLSNEYTQLSISVPVYINDSDVFSYLERNKLKEFWERRKYYYIRYHFEEPNYFNHLWTQTKKNWDQLFAENEFLEKLIYEKIFPGEQLSKDESQLVHQEFNVENMTELGDIIEAAWLAEEWVENNYDNLKNEGFGELVRNQLDLQISIIKGIIDHLRKGDIWKEKDYRDLYELHNFYNVKNIIGDKSKRKLSQRRIDRAYLFRGIKDINPELSKLAVALRASDDELERISSQIKKTNPTYDDDRIKSDAIVEFTNKWKKSTFTEDDVNNDYRAMGWEWIRGK